MQSESPTILEHSNIGIVGSNPAQGMHLYPYVSLLSNVSCI
jgi:hypothetical protein